MARPPNTTLDAALLAAVARHPDGASIEEIVRATKAARRSAQRRLSVLVDQGHLRATGPRNQRRYHLLVARSVFELREALPEPDPVRFRNREALTEIVNAIVRDDLSIDDAAIRPLATRLTTPEDLEQLIAMAFVELHGLHEGNIARHRLRPSEFRRWRERHLAADR
jgi:hypothetical protein